jgi:hypothetical protein
MKSEGHLRAMRVFADNPGRALGEFSGLFLKGFLDTLSHRHGTKRVLANTVYQEYVYCFKLRQNIIMLVAGILATRITST